MDTKFFIELAADEYGNTAMKTSVVEATIVEKDGKELLIPVAPQHFVDGWPSGWYRSSYGGWAEVEGPARILTYEEHKEILEGLDTETIENTESDSVELRTGVKMPLFMVKVAFDSIQQLMQSDPIGYYELVQLARNPQHTLWGSYSQVLASWSLIEADGQPHDVMRDIVLASAKGDDMDLKLVWPVAS